MIKQIGRRKNEIGYTCYEINCSDKSKRKEEVRQL